MSSASIDEKSSGPALDIAQVDTAARLVAGKDLHVDPAEAARVRRKIDLYLMPLMCFLYWCVCRVPQGIMVVTRHSIQYADKSTLANSAVLGIQKSTHMSVKFIAGQSSLVECDAF
jgi:ACS family allantoate permease-like MFS transporter